MPVHEWNRVVPGIFHDFHQCWVIEIRNALNGGLLPDDHYALAEQSMEDRIPDVVTLERSSCSSDDARTPLAPTSGGLALAEHPPQVSYRLEGEHDAYVRKANRIAVYHSAGDRVVGYIEIVSPGNKSSDRAMKAFLNKVSEAFDNEIHLLVIDLHRPTSRDPRGLHDRIWRDNFDDATSEQPGATPLKPFTLVAYKAGNVPVAYYEPVGLGQPLPDMPIFLTPQRYVNVPLEATYQEAWRGVPQRWKEVIAAQQVASHPAPGGL